MSENWAEIFCSPTRGRLRYSPENDAAITSCPLSLVNVNRVFRQFRVLVLGLFENQVLRVCIFPEGKKIPITRSRFLNISG